MLKSEKVFKKIIKENILIIDKFKFLNQEYTSKKRQVNNTNMLD